MKPTEDDPPRGRKEAPKFKKRDEKADDEDAPRKKRGDKADDEPPARRKGARGKSSSWDAPATSAWNGFGAGCSLAWWGLWIEFLAVTYGFALTGYIFLGLLDDPKGMLFKINDAGGPMVLAPMFVGVLLGTLLTLLGRTRMTSIPAGTGAKKVILGAWAFTGIRVIAAIGGTILILMAGTEWPDVRTATNAVMDTRGKDAFAYLILALGAFLVGLPFWILADLSTIPAVAIVGGAIPSEGIRRRAGWVTFILQALVLAYVGLAVAGGIAIGSVVSKIDFKPQVKDAVPPKGQVPTPTATTRNTELEGVKPALTAVLGFGVAIQFAYTILFGSLYGAARRGVIEAREATETAADEDV